MLRFLLALTISCRASGQHAPTLILATHLFRQQRRTPIHATTLTPVSSAQNCGGNKPKRKKARKPLGNREAVRKYRQKKKAHAAHLEEEVKKLRAINQQLVKSLQGQAALEAEMARLRALLVDVRAKIDGALGSYPFQAQCGVGNVSSCGGMAQCFAGKPELGVNRSCAPSVVNCHISPDSGQNLEVPYALSPSDVIGNFIVSSISKDE